MQRRDFLRCSLFSAALLFPLSSFARFQKSMQPKIVICGGGYAGLSVAYYLKELNNYLDVTIIEKNKRFVSCPFSNAYLGEVQDITLSSLTFSYKDAIKKNKCRFINEEIYEINRDKKEVYTKYQNISYDILIMAVGIDYNYEALFNNEKTIKEVIKKAPAGLKPPFEHTQLKSMIETFTKGNFIITVPNGSYKCPPAPYERACMIAHYFQTHGVEGKVIILDPREQPAAKPKQFLEVFTTLYKNTIEYHGLTNLKDINFKTKEIYAESFDKNKFDYVDKTVPFEQANIIPPNKANELIKQAKLELNDHGFAKLKRPTFQSSIDDDVYILGDAQGEYPFPKSAQMANSCALNVANEIISRLYNLPYSLKENMPGNICYSLVSDTKAVSIMHTYTYDEKPTVSSFISAIDEGTALSAKNWYEGLTATLFK